MFGHGDDDAVFERLTLSFVHCECKCWIQSKSAGKLDSGRQEMVAAVYWSPAVIGGSGGIGVASATTANGQDHAVVFQRTGRPLLNELMPFVVVVGVEVHSKIHGCWWNGQRNNVTWFGVVVFVQKVLVIGIAGKN